ncbi:hypothetical protein B0W47_01775 [Komagataeibacter nataicola]|uniref:Uncharacterized protein n=1 Tax=Komagataeibacter nataicola TaxID=265960 RepID=A0A9N7CPN5_9PROT|nr:hypothetical protein [Komagataeibacter nataicola]AQU86391.1 hypothetical protein B0W47_01775 [Komagataeibacter nataicola]PYD65555.1 hypothetical protein CDI09_12845 [Komagataeibacter nataicola]WEQ56721.1 hypothetical protein LV564_06510 [Komagataeibacter nataicola]WNM08193.1 hypothetical protein RI056_15045 [Komagataeibacter nataicola]
MMGLPPAPLTDLKTRVIAPTLAFIGLGGSAAVNLIAGIALVETGCRALVQSGGGPALGLWQMEPFTHDDIWATFLPAQRLSAIRARLFALQAAWPMGSDRATQLIGNLPYACAMARLKCYRAPEPIPAANDAAGQCRFWKTNYNTTLGAGDVDPQHVALFEQAIEV